MTRIIVRALRIVCAGLIDLELIESAVGRPCADRQWMECYAQLVGTVLSLWEASALDAAGGADVPATFINLADASIKMVCVFTHKLYYSLEWCFCTFNRLLEFLCT